MNLHETWQHTEQQDDSSGEIEIPSELAHVRVIIGGTAGTGVHPITSKAGLSIGGAGGDCELTIEDRLMSRRHARIERSAAGWQLQDLGARNRGWVDGRGYATGARLPLADGAVLRFGDTVMVFRASPPTTDGQTSSPVFPGVSPVAVAVRRRIGQLASGTGHVLIIGETGAGKERIARAIGDGRAPHAFVTLNSAELGRDLARAELFGHRRGVFTGATDNRAGLVEQAGEGVLFLDEIGELSLDVQPELLRFLEDGSYRPIGGDLRHSNARVVAATHVDLDQAVQATRFRRDLLARLRASNTPLSLPALRERREDIPGWTQLFLRERGLAADDDAWTAGAVECLLLYPWPENLRQLRSVIGEIVEGGPGPWGTEHLPARLRAHRQVLRASAQSQQDEPHTPSQLTRQVELSRADIEEVLQRTQGNVRMTAQLLGLDRRKLYRLCERFGIGIESFRADTNREDA